MCILKTTLSLAMLCSIATTAFAQTLENDPVATAWKQEKFNAEVIKCGECHFAPTGGFTPRPTDFCQLSELKTWIEKDKHSVARRRVEPLIASQIEKVKADLVAQKVPLDQVKDWYGKNNELSYAMCIKLGYDVKTNDGYAKFRDNCLTCHGGYDPHSKIELPGFGNEVMAARPGISCTYCHQNDKSGDWVKEHSDSSPTKPAWRLKTPEAKQQLGMRDLLDTQNQANLCNSCHIGNHAEGKFVTHEMYVAGHPPLPSIELYEYEKAMPFHWRDLRQTYEALKSFDKRDDYFKVNLPKLATKYDDVYFNTRTMMLGAVSSARNSLSMIGDVKETEWGNYALYDCTACHHELRLPSRRQQRGYVGAPGRPRLAEWPAALLNAVARMTGDASQLTVAQKQLLETVAKTPFGQQIETQAAVKQLDQVLVMIADKVASMNIDRQLSEKLLRELALTDSNLLIDYHSARQIVWATKCIDEECADRKSPLSEPIHKAIEELGKSASELFVSKQLPSGRGGDLFPSFLSGELSRIAGYDVQKLSQQLQQLSKLLP